MTDEREAPATMTEGSVVISREDAAMWLTVANMNIMGRACTDVLLESLAARLRAQLGEK